MDKFKKIIKVDKLCCFHTFFYEVKWRNHVGSTHF